MSQRISTISFRSDPDKRAETRTKESQNKLRFDRPKDDAVRRTKGKFYSLPLEFKAILIIFHNVIKIIKIQIHISKNIEYW